jgi:hypothetical protein
VPTREELDEVWEVPQDEAFLLEAEVGTYLDPFSDPSLFEMAEGWLRIDVLEGQRISFAVELYGDERGELEISQPGEDLSWFGEPTLLDPRCAPLVVEYGFVASADGTVDLRLAVIEEHDLGFVEAGSIGRFVTLAVGPEPSAGY